jgi:hypothetical protein
VTQSVHHRHPHRERRFHVRPEAIGLDYERYDVPIPAPEPTSPPAELEEEMPEEQVLSEREQAHRRASKGMKVCLGILIAFLISLRFGWLFDLYLRAVQAYSWFLQQLRLN